MAAAAMCCLSACGTAPTGSTTPAHPVPRTWLESTAISDARMSDQQRHQAFQSAAAQGWACYAAWVQTLDTSSLPYQTLPHSQMSGGYAPPDGSTLAQSLAAADLVVRATVMTLK